MIEERVTASERLTLPLRLATTQIAEAMLGPIRLWIAGESAATSSVLAASLLETAAALRATLGLAPKE